MRLLHLILFCIISMLPMACSDSLQHVTQSDNQLELRQLQTRAYDTANQQKTARAIVATLQDLGFIIDRADMALGTISATRLDSRTLKATVTFRQRGKRTLVRVNVNRNNRTVTDPNLYQDFFVALDKSLFLVAQQVG
jgi:hypothetical protein